MGLLLLLHTIVARELSADDYGLFSVLLTSAALIGLILGIGLPNTAQKFVASYLENQEIESLEQYLTLVVGWLGAMSLFLIGAAFITDRLGTPEVNGVSVYLVAILVAGVGLWLTQRNISLGRSWHILAILPRDVFLPVITIFYVIFIDTHDVFGILWFYAICNVCFCTIGLFLVLRINTQRKLKISIPDRLSVRKWLSTAKHFLLTSTLQLGLNGWDIIILGVFATLSETGRYALAVRVASVLMVILRVANTFVGNRFAQYHAAGRAEENKRMYIRVCLISAVVGLALLLVFILTLGYVENWIGESYTDIKHLILILGITNFLCVCLGPSLTYFNMVGFETYVSRETLYWSLLSIVGNILVIPLIGVQGAVFMYVVCNLGLRMRLFLKFYRS